MDTNDPGVQTQRICRNGEEKDCPYGTRCKFRHVKGQSTLASSTTQQYNKNKPDLSEDHLAWRRMVRTTPRNTAAVVRFWLAASKLLETEDKVIKQQVILEIVSRQPETGLCYVKELLDVDHRQIDNATYLKAVHAFFNVLTDSALLSSLSIDSYVGDLYNFVSGSGGSRAMPFFQQLCVACATPTQIRSAQFVLPLLITALREMLTRTQRSILNEQLSALVDTLFTLVKDRTLFSDDALHSTCTKQLDDIKALVDRSLARLADPTLASASAKVTISTYPKSVIMPGGRHDNDCADISKIQVFPTAAELLSDKAEYLPTLDTIFDRLEDRQRRFLDFQFRLLRRDIFGELKTTLAEIMRRFSQPATAQSAVPGNLHIYQYPGVFVSKVLFDVRKGIEFCLAFPQPHSIHRKSAADKQRWWAASKRLEEGSLLALISVDDTHCRSFLMTVSSKSTENISENDLNDNNLAYVNVQPIIENDLAEMLRLPKNNSTQRRALLVEYPGIKPATFTPILENLQEMQKLGRLPLQQWIMDFESNEEAKIPSPEYARSPGFQFDLQPILKDADERLMLGVPEACQPETLQKVLNATTLDEGQCAAFASALTSEFALIQGPPGTGKSYLGTQLVRVLLHNRAKHKLGPVLIVCYTNHALDQFLEHLVDGGIEKLVRIGGQSKSETIKAKNLRLISRQGQKTPFEGYQVASAHRKVEELQVAIREKLAILHNLKPEWKKLKTLLSEEHPEIFLQFSKYDEEGFELAGNLEPFDLWKTGANYLNLPYLGSLSHQASISIFSLTPHQRLALIEEWMQEIRSALVDTISDLVHSFNSQRQIVASVHDEVDRRVLEDAEVIGVTTTGLAKRMSVLQRVGINIVMCEEAAEVLEAHMLSVLLPEIQHLIQIGDHQQLRPQINSYDLSMESLQGAQYQLNRSQFERLAIRDGVRSGFPVSQLHIQRRMRPDISELIRNTQYPHLKDHDDIKLLPNVVGIRQNLFWLDHRHFEHGENPESVQRSKSNDWEVEMTHALVRHIVRQGVYRSKDIAVLTPYTGQIQKLRTRMQQDFEVIVDERDEEQLAKDGLVDDLSFQKQRLSDSVRIATIDNFQGEEATIVVVSLVRSNDRCKVGFLRTENRINVLLSRAKHGMYLIGNAQTYINIPMWAKVLGNLRLKGAVGTSFPLCCARHPETEISVTSPQEFELRSPEGGCRLSCDQRLVSCGHRCLAKCHSAAMHSTFVCPQPCQRLHTPCDHMCPKICGESCGPCYTVVDGVALPCGHSKNEVPCYQTFAVGMIKCNVIVSRMMPDCGHEVDAECCRDIKSLSCRVPCSTPLPCGHICPGTCGQCQKGTSHVDCQKKCARPRGVCNHTCPSRCHYGKACDLCCEPCEVQCKHSRCGEQCHRPCVPCVERCDWNCEHQGACSMPCSAPCDRLPCSLRCDNKLACGHQCPGICGEDCSVDYCQLCCTPEKQDRRVDLFELKLYREINLDENPIIILPCGHFFTAETLDGLMSMSKVYEVDAQTRNFVGLREGSELVLNALPRCPDCNAVVPQFATKRYNRIVNRAVLDETCKRLLVESHSKLHDFDEKARELDSKLVERIQEIKSILAKGQTSEFANRLRGLSRLQDEQRTLEGLTKKVSDNHRAQCQPRRRLYEATMANRLVGDHDRLTLAMQSGLLAPPDRRAYYAGRLLYIKVKSQILCHRLALLDISAGNLHPSLARISASSDSTLQAVETFFKPCEELIIECDNEKLPRLSVEARLYFAQTVISCQQCRKFADTKTRQAEANAFLEGAQDICNTREFIQRDELRSAVEVTQKLLGMDRYEEITAEEMQLIKKAMISGSRGLATHSGHWYNCRNGHPFAIGECGMPMQEARCPECGEPIGGQSHNFVDGITRAREME